jgi:phage/conjugal plasmid C-4 type zinc finger TraR family protein
MTIKERQLNDDWQYNNEEEAEMGQLHAIHNNMNAVANVRRALEEQASQPSLTHCEECGEEIPEKRRTAIRGVRLCVYCQQLLERTKGK